MCMILGACTLFARNGTSGQCDFFSGEAVIGDRSEAGVDVVATESLRIREFLTSADDPRI